MAAIEPRSLSMQTVALPDEPFVLVDTDIESSTALWEWNPKIMSRCLRVHDQVLRHNLLKWRGTELFTEGDAFLVFFPNAADALQWCVEVQRELLKVQWPMELLDCGIESVAEVTGQNHEVIFWDLCPLGSPNPLNPNPCAKWSTKKHRVHLVTRRLVACGGSVPISQQLQSQT